jgi:hypothetical protein
MGKVVPMAGRLVPFGQIGRTEDPLARLHEEVAKALYCYAAATVISGDKPAWSSVSHPTRQWFLDEAFVLASYSLERYGRHIGTSGRKC